MKPVKGVVHAAGILDDHLVMDLERSLQTRSQQAAIM